MMIVGKRKREEEIVSEDFDIQPYADVPSFPDLESQNGGTKKDDTRETQPKDPEPSDELKACMLPGDDLSSADEDFLEQEAEDDEVVDKEEDHEEGEEDDASCCADNPQAESRRLPPCVCCELATSEVVKAMDQVADRLAGRAGDAYITQMQLDIYNRRMAPLRAEGRPVRCLTRKMLQRHYRTHRVSIMRAVAEEIRVFELMGRTLRRTGLCDVDADGRVVLTRSATHDMTRLSKQKMDLMKFYVTLSKARREEEANSGNAK